MKQAIDDDRAKKCVAKSTKSTAQMNKAERLLHNAQLGGRDGGHDRGRGRGRGGGRGRGRGGYQGGHSETFVKLEVWKQLTPQVQSIIRNSTARKTSEGYCQMNATQMTYGAIQLPDALWAQLLPGAQSAIATHNKTLGGASTQTNMHTQMYSAAQMNQMSN